jgi:hypothetical protein
MIDVTPSLRAWAMDQAANRGWVFSPVPSNEQPCSFNSTENGPDRPFLTVTFVP